VRCLLAAIRCSKIDINGNLGVHLRVLGQARAAGCDLVLFPEMSLTGSVNPAAHPERLIGLGHGAVAALAAAAAPSAHELMGQRPGPCERGA
jgi:predicted amidohydrolase